MGLQILSPHSLARYMGCYLSWLLLLGLGPDGWVLVNRTSSLVLLVTPNLAFRNPLRDQPLLFSLAMVTTDHMLEAST